MLRMEALKRILVVEDDEAIRRGLIDFLRERERVDVDGARDGVEALHQLALNRYAVIVLDVWMPKMTGVDFLESLRVLGKDPAVVVITATPQSELRDDEIAQHYPSLVRGVFRKPLDVRELATAVDQLLAH